MQTIEKNQTSGTCDIRIEIKMTMKPNREMVLFRGQKGKKQVKPTVVEL